MKIKPRKLVYNGRSLLIFTGGKLGNSYERCGDCSVVFGCCLRGNNSIHIIA